MTKFHVLPPAPFATLRPPPCGHSAYVRETSDFRMSTLSSTTLTEQAESFAFGTATTTTNMHEPLGVPERQQGEYGFLCKRIASRRGCAVSRRCIVPWQLSASRACDGNAVHRGSKGAKSLAERSSADTIEADRSLRRADPRTGELSLQVHVVPLHYHVQRRERGAEPVSETGGESTDRPSG